MIGERLHTSSKTKSVLHEFEQKFTYPPVRRMELRETIVRCAYSGTTVSFDLFDDWEVATVRPDLSCRGSQHTLSESVRFQLCCDDLKNSDTTKSKMIEVEQMCRTIIRR